MRPSEGPTIPQLVDTLKYATFINFDTLDAQYFLPGTSISQISECESLVGHAIPSDIWELWSECGGERGTFGIIMGSRFLSWRQSIDLMLEYPAHFSDCSKDDVPLLPLFVDDCMHAVVAVRLHSGEVVVIPEPDTMTEDSSALVIEDSLLLFLQKLCTALVENSGRYEVQIPECRYAVLIGDGSYIRHLVAQKIRENSTLEQLQKFALNTINE